MDKEKEIKKQQMKKPVHPIHGEVVEFSFLAGDNGHPYVCEDQLELSIMLKYDVILHFNQSEAILYTPTYEFRGLKGLFNDFTRGVQQKDTVSIRFFFLSFFQLLVSQIGHKWSIQ